MIMTQNAMIRSLVWNLRLVGSWGSVWPAITNLRRSLEAQNQIVADCRRDWRNLLGRAFCVDLSVGFSTMTGKGSGKHRVEPQAIVGIRRKLARALLCFVVGCCAADRPDNHHNRLSRSFPGLPDLLGVPHSYSDGGSQVEVGLWDVVVQGLRKQQRIARQPPAGERTGEATTGTPPGRVSVL